MQANETTSDDPTESLPPGPLRLLNPQRKKIFGDSAPKLPESEQTLCTCCPAAIWRQEVNGRWVALCTMFRDMRTPGDPITACEGYNMATAREEPER